MPLQSVIAEARTVRLGVRSARTGHWTVEGRVGGTERIKAATRKDYEKEKVPAISFACGHLKCNAVCVALVEDKEGLKLRVEVIPEGVQYTCKAHE